MPFAHPWTLADCRDLKRYPPRHFQSGKVSRKADLKFVFFARRVKVPTRLVFFWESSVLPFHRCRWYFTFPSRIISSIRLYLVSLYALSDHFLRNKPFFFGLDRGLAFSRMTEVVGPMSLSILFSAINVSRGPQRYPMLHCTMADDHLAGNSWSFYNQSCTKFESAAGYHLETRSTGYFCVRTS